MSSVGRGGGCFDWVEMRWVLCMRIEEVSVVCVGREEVGVLCGERGSGCYVWGERRRLVLCVRM